MEGRHVDVIEMDAASHTGIDDIREIIEQVRYAPVSARYKVYIIDEVHMLSTQAFNGLLKTLEEPPPHVKFIFATTEIRKVPITILSRCQRFDLRRVDAGDADRQSAHDRRPRKHRCRRRGAGDDRARGRRLGARCAVDLRPGDRAWRGRGDRRAVRAMLGLADRARIVDLFEHLMKGDAAAALTEFRAQYDVGADPAAVLTDLAEFNHLVTRLRFVPSAASDASLSEDERRRGAEFAKALSVRVLSRTWQMLLKGIPEVQASNRPVSAAEMVLIRLAHAADLPTLDEALKSLGDAPQSSGAVNGGGRAGRVVAGCRAVGSGGSAVAQTRMPAGSGGGQTMRLVEAAPAPEIRCAACAGRRSAACRAGAVAGRHRRACRSQSRHAFKVAVQELREAGSHRAGPCGRQPHRRCAQNAGHRPERPSRRMDRAALDGVGFARGGRPDAGRDGSGQARKRVPGRQERSGGGCDPVALSRRRRSSTCAFPTRRTPTAGEPICRPTPAAEDDDETDL